MDGLDHPVPESDSRGRRYLLHPAVRSTSYVMASRLLLFVGAVGVSSVHSRSVHTEQETSAIRPWVPN